nr:unnamed protein product [Digitaria exilis]
MLSQLHRRRRLLQPALRMKCANTTLSARSASRNNASRQIISSEFRRRVEPSASTRNHENPWAKGLTGAGYKAPCRRRIRSLRVQISSMPLELDSLANTPEPPVRPEPEPAQKKTNGFLPHKFKQKNPPFGEGDNEFDA